MTAPNDYPVKHKVENDGDGWEDVCKKELEEFESVQVFVELNEQNGPEKYEDEGFCDEDHVEESGVPGGEGHCRLVETHNQEVDKGESQRPVGQVAFV